MLNFADNGLTSKTMVVVAALLVPTGSLAWVPPETEKPLALKREIVKPVSPSASIVLDTQTAPRSHFDLGDDKWLKTSALNSFNSPVGTNIAGDKFVPTAISKIGKRLEELRKFSAEEEEHYSEDSEEALFSFLEKIGAKKRPYVALLDSGNLRAVWKGVDGQQIGIQFLGSDEVQFVLFAKREGSAKTAKIFGQDVFSGIVKNIYANGLHDLI